MALAELSIRQISTRYYAAINQSADDELKLRDVERPPHLAC
jgi:hypothetical protein